MTSLTDTRSRYGAGSIALHWIVAFAFIALLVSGYAMMVLPRGPRFGQALTWHNGIGCLFLAFAAGRLVWRAVNPLPALTAASRWENIAARVDHALLWFFILALPLTGWVAASTGRRPISIFGWFDFPKIWGNDPAMHRLSEEWHGILSHVFVVVFALHIAGALKREYVNRDGTLRRMLGAGPGAR
jgi:cytochrome b561